MPVQQHTRHTTPDDGLEPQVLSVPVASPSREGQLSGLSSGQAQAVAVVIAAAILIVVVLACNFIAWAF